MKSSSRYNLDITNAIIGFGIWFLSFWVYYLTKAVTLSFWDCGEFIAAGYVLGIPHPPGSPLWVMVGRIFSILPISSDIAVRVNMLSGFCSSFTALFGYLASVRILWIWFGSDRSTYSRLLIYGGAASGALFLAFGLTNWTNSVEAEVYGMSMMLMIAMLWLILLYLERRGTALGERIMLLIVFLAFLGIGVHMITFLVFPVAALVFIIKKDAGVATWFTAALFFAAELYLVFVLSSQVGELPWYLPVVIVFVFYLFYVFSFDRIPRLFLYVGGGFLLATAPGWVTAINIVGKAYGVSGVVGGSVQQVLTIVAQLATAALILTGLYCLSKYLGKSATGARRSVYLTAASFTLTAGIASALLHVPKGYTTFLVLSAIMALVVAAFLWRHIHWPILTAAVGASLVVMDLSLFVIGIGVAAAALLAMGLGGRLPRWRTGLMILVMAVAGFSVHLFIPIRSAQQPSLNENNPSESLRTTVNFLERKQYGTQSMVERMFMRRADWVNQFGNHRRMGFWGFFQQQYGLRGSKFVLLLLLGLFGVWEVVRRSPVAGWPLVVLLLLSTVGLVLYMNFADGTRQGLGTGPDHIEVRDRDYFFTPGFVLFGLAIGIGAAIVVQYIRSSVRRFSALPRKTVLSCALVVLLLPGYALGVNYYYCDRSRNFIPYDYAWNLLDSADENAVLFTNGDNDTFPLWCLQEVYGVRTDVKVVNLSLANLRWYIKQLQSNLGLDLGWSDERIDRLRPFRVPDSATLSARGQIVDKSVYGYLGLSSRKLDSVYRSAGVPYGATFPLRAQVVDKLIYSRLGREPINFSVTSGRGSRVFLGRRIDSLLSLNGMMWRVNETGGAIRADMESSVDFFTRPGRFSARGVNDPTIYKNEATRRLVSNFTNGFLLVADSLRARGDIRQAEELARLAVEQMPLSADAVEYLAGIYGQQGRVEDLSALYRKTVAGDRSTLAVMMALAYRQIGDDIRAEQLLDSLLTADETCRPAFEELVRLYFENNQVGSMDVLLKRWLRTNPGDRRARLMLEELRRGLDSFDSVRGSGR